MWCGDGDLYSKLVLSAHKLLILLDGRSGGKHKKWASWHVFGAQTFLLEDSRERIDRQRPQPAQMPGIVGPTPGKSELMILVPLYRCIRAIVSSQNLNTLRMFASCERLQLTLDFWGRRLLEVRVGETIPDNLSFVRPRTPTLLLVPESRKVFPDKNTLTVSNKFHHESTTRRCHLNLFRGHRRNSCGSREFRRGLHSERKNCALPK